MSSKWSVQCPRNRCRKVWNQDNATCPNCERTGTWVVNELDKSYGNETWISCSYCSVSMRDCFKCTCGALLHPKRIASAGEKFSDTLFCIVILGIMALVVIIGVFGR